MRSHSSTYRRAKPRRFETFTPVAVCMLVLLAACDLPTEGPQVESRWIVPAEETRFGVGELLPGDVTFAPDSSAFLVAFDPVSISRTLEEVCSACVPFDGFTVPKPAFAASFGTGITFPSEVTSIELLEGEIEIEAFNGSNFDPIRPAAAATGTITITITDDADGDVLGTLLVDGAETAFDAGSTLTRTIELVPSTVDGSLAVTVEVDSPLGDAVTIDITDLFEVDATPNNVRVGIVTIDVAGRSVDVDPVTLDLEDVDSDITDRLVEGAFVLEVINPFGIGADFDLSISGPTIASIDKSVAIGSAATSTARIDFTLAELRSFLGEPGVVLEGGAVIDAGAGAVSVSPGQELVLLARLDLTILIGG